MEKVRIYYFSGTGNTEKVAKRLAESLAERKIATVLEKIDGEFHYPEEDETIGIAYPVHAFSAPENVIKFAEGLPEKGKEVPVFFIKTSGEPLSLNDASSAKTAKILKRKGYKIIDEYHYVMPYNMLYKHTESMATKMWFTAKRMIERDVESLIAGKERKLKGDSAISVIFRNVEQPFMKFNGKRFKVDGEKCIGCNMCVNRCPQKNIKIENGKFIFGDNCIGCVRCSFNCPTDAIKIGIINFWKVNGKYSYGDEEPEVAECKYLKRAYRSYFAKNN